MNSLKLFTSVVSELEELPEVPTIFWYPSAGLDFRPLVYLTQNRIDHFRINNKKEFIHSNLYVYNCLGHEVGELKNKLENGDTILFEDDNTKIIGKNFKQLTTNPEMVQFRIDPKHIDIDGLKLPKKGQEMFFFEADIIGKGSDNPNYEETQKVLYLEAENHDVYRKIILKKDLFKTVGFSNTREGIAWGRALGGSIIEEIYPATCTTTNNHFNPQFAIIFNDYTKDVFKSGLKARGIRYKEDYANYIWSTIDYMDSTVFRLYNSNSKPHDLSYVY